MMETPQKDTYEATTAQANIGDNNGITADALKLPDRYADESYKLFSEIKATEPTPEEATKIRDKLLWRIVPFLCIGYHLMFLDKQTVRSGPDEGGIPRTQD